MDLKKRIFRIVAIGVMLSLVMSLPGLASILITFQNALQPGQIEYYWNTESSAPNDGRTPAGYVGDATESQPAVAFDAVPSTRYAFWAGTTQPNSTGLHARVWNNASKSTGSYYTAVKDYTNPTGSGATGTFTPITWAYAYLPASQAIISSYVESKTVTNPTGPTPTISGTVTFNSAQPLVAGTLEVQVAQAEWKMDEVVIATTKNMTKNASDFVAGVTYVFKVKHKSYVGDWGPESAPLGYTSSGAPGPSAVFNIAVRRPAGGTGINSFSVPSDTCTISSPMKDGVAATVTTPTISNALQLCQAINEIQGGACVRTFGYWNEVTQQAAGVVLQYSGSTITNATDLSGIALQKGRGYQVYVRPETDTAVNITFNLQ